MKDLKTKHWKTNLSNASKHKELKNDTTVATKTRDLPANLIANQESCVLCQKSISVKKMPELIRSALYRKYSGDLDSFYSRDIRYILKQRRCRSFIWFIDMCILDEPEEFLNGLYSINKSLHKLYNYGIRYNDKILQPKICIEKFERLHCWNYHKKILMKAGEYNRKDDRKKNKDGEKNKSYSQMLLQLTREQSGGFGANNGHFLFDSRNPSLSTINGESQQFNYELGEKSGNNESSFTVQQKINIKEILKGQVQEISSRKKKDYKPFIEDESMSFIHHSSNSYYNNAGKTINSFITENPFPEEIEFTTENSELFKKKFYVNVKNLPTQQSDSNTLHMDSMGNALGSFNQKNFSDKMSDGAENYKSSDNLFIVENFNMKNDNRNSKNLGKKLQPTRITSDALNQGNGSVSKGEQGVGPQEGNSRSKKVIKIDQGAQKMRENKSQTNINMQNIQRLNTELSQKEFRAMNSVAEKSKGGYQKTKESPRMFLLSSQEIDLRKSEILTEKNPIGKNSSNIKHKSTKSEAMTHMPSSTKSGT